MRRISIVCHGERPHISHHLVAVERNGPFTKSPSLILLMVIASNCAGIASVSR
uniref:Uncharacterized protein n=1 Tax=uncultured marine virus TaxID=186617 RepID=A0A0F7L5K6_9VIRU|nr:hypothetical protein [uncultured marine virus]